MRSLLLISFVEWAGAWQRPHHLADRFARRGWRVVYASPGYVHRRGQRTPSGLVVPDGLEVIEPTALPGSSRSRAVASGNRAWMQRRLAAVTREPWDAIVFNDPRFAPVAATLPARRRVFDCMDDLAAEAPSPRQAERWLADALAAADRVWTGTPSLADHLRDRHPRVRFIAGGVDAERFAAPDRAAVEAAHHEMPPGDGPLAGYFGVLNERVDMTLVEALLDSGAWRVVLIGPATSRAPRLPDSPRLRWLGPRPYAALPAYLALFDLALIPYDTRGPHRFLYPVKALEYLAAEKPVLATPLPDLQRLLSNYLELADGPAAWREAAARLLKDPAPALARARAGQAEACRRTWDAMVDEMTEELEA